MAFPNRAVFPPLTRAHVYLVKTIGQNSVLQLNKTEVEECHESENHVMEGKSCHGSENNVMVNLYVRRNIRWAINPIPD